MTTEERIKQLDERIMLTNARIDTLIKHIQLNSCSIKEHRQVQNNIIEQINKLSINSTRHL